LPARRLAGVRPNKIKVIVMIIIIITVIMIIIIRRRINII